MHTSKGIVDGTFDVNGVDPDLDIIPPAPLSLERRDLGSSASSIASIENMYFGRLS
jgi:hypothetical protein